MRIVSVVGARPQFVKLAPIATATKRAGIDHLIVHTGQHYDPNMSSSFFKDLGIGDPDFHLGVGSGGHGEQTGRMLEALDPVLSDVRPDWVVVYGDTNSTLAAAISAVKLHLRVAHLEAGLRSFNRAMPEEHNRVLTDHASDLCLAPTFNALQNLAAEGLGARSMLVGDVMTDVCLNILDRVRAEETPGPVDGEFVLATIHRAENTDSPNRLRAIVDALHALPVRVVLPIHPRLRARAEQYEITLDAENVTLCEPLPYQELIAAAFRAKAVVTDSGGLQKEAFLVNTPCITVRTETEWTETVDLGWNILAAEPGSILPALASLDPTPTAATPYGDGNAANSIVQELTARL